MLVVSPWQEVKAGNCCRFSKAIWTSGSRKRFWIKVVHNMGEDCQASCFRMLVGANSEVFFPSSTLQVLLLDGSSFQASLPPHPTPSFYTLYYKNRNQESWELDGDSCALKHPLSNNIQACRNWITSFSTLTKTLHHSEPFLSTHYQVKALQFIYSSRNQLSTKDDCEPTSYAEAKLTFALFLVFFYLNSAFTTSFITSFLLPQPFPLLNVI